MCASWTPRRCARSSIRRPAASLHGPHPPHRHDEPGGGRLHHDAAGAPDPQTALYRRPAPPRRRRHQCGRVLPARRAAATLYPLAGPRGTSCTDCSGTSSCPPRHGHCRRNTHQLHCPRSLQRAGLPVCAARAAAGPKPNGRPAWPGWRRSPGTGLAGRQRQPCHRACRTTFMHAWPGWRRPAGNRLVLDSSGPALAAALAQAWIWSSPACASCAT